MSVGTWKPPISSIAIAATAHGLAGRHAAARMTAPFPFSAARVNVMPDMPTPGIAWKPESRSYVPQVTSPRRGVFTEISPAEPVDYVPGP